MSASLVGSEMCIRDRILASTLVLGLSSSAFCPAASSPAPAFACAPSTPVSYTHLTLPTICSV
eukprot:1030380-Alexandrium_andersonii.AAC.1